MARDTLIISICSCKIRRAPLDAQFLAPIWRAIEACYHSRKLSQDMGHVLREITIVEKIATHGNRFFQTSNVVQPVCRYQQRVAWFDDAFIGRRAIEEGKSLEIRLLWIDLPAVQKIRILGRKEDRTFSTLNLGQIGMRVPIIAMECRQRALRPNENCRVLSVGRPLENVS